MTFDNAPKPTQSVEPKKKKKTWKEQQEEKALKLKQQQALELKRKRDAERFSPTTPEQDELINKIANLFGSAKPSRAEFMIRERLGSDTRRAVRGEAFIRLDLNKLLNNFRKLSEVKTRSTPLIDLLAAELRPDSDTGARKIPEVRQGYNLTTRDQQRSEPGYVYYQGGNRKK